MDQQPHFYTFLLTACSCFIVQALWTEHPQTAERVNAYLPTNIPPTAEFSSPISIQSAFTKLTGITRCPIEVVMPEDPKAQIFWGVFLAGAFTYTAFFFCFVVWPVWLHAASRVGRLSVLWLYATGIRAWHLLVALGDKLRTWSERFGQESHDINIHVVSLPSITQNDWESIRCSDLRIDEVAMADLDNARGRRASSAPASPRPPRHDSDWISPVGSGQASLVVGNRIVPLYGPNSRLLRGSWPPTTRASVHLQSRIDLSNRHPPLLSPQRSTNSSSPIEDQSVAESVALGKTKPVTEDADDDAAE